MSDRSRRRELLEAELREALGDQASVWTASRSRWLHRTTRVQTAATPAATRVRALLLKKRRLLLVR